MSNELHEALRANFLFRMLTQQEIETIAADVRVLEFDSGATIVNEGDVADALYLVVAGNVNVMKGNDQFLSMLGRNGFFGEMGLFAEGALRSANCVAATPTRCAVIDKRALHSFCEQFPHIGVKVYRAIIETLAERLQSTSADLAMLMSAQVRGQREVSQVVQRAKTQKVPRPGGAED